jgi:hypothetical protein
MRLEIGKLWAALPPCSLRSPKSDRLLGGLEDAADLRSYKRRLPAGNRPVVRFIGIGEAIKTVINRNATFMLLCELPFQFIVRSSAAIIPNTTVILQL